MYVYIYIYIYKYIYIYLRAFSSEKATRSICIYRRFVFVPKKRQKNMTTKKTKTAEHMRNQRKHMETIDFGKLIEETFRESRRL